MTRQEANKLILELIKRYVEECPDQRFGQILFNLKINEFQNSQDPLEGLRDIYGDESETILRRLRLP